MVNISNCLKSRTFRQTCNSAKTSIHRVRGLSFPEGQEALQNADAEGPRDAERSQQIALEVA